MLITPCHKDRDLRRNRSQLVPIEFKSGSSYIKHAINCHKQTNFFKKNKNAMDERTKIRSVKKKIIRLLIIF